MGQVGSDRVWTALFGAALGSVVLGGVLLFWATLDGPIEPPTAPLPAREPLFEVSLERLPPPSPPPRPSRGYWRVWDRKASAYTVLIALDPYGGLYLADRQAVWFAQDYWGNGAVRKPLAALPSSVARERGEIMRGGQTYRIDDDSRLLLEEGPEGQVMALSIGPVDDFVLSPGSGEWLAVISRRRVRLHRLDQVRRIEPEPTTRASLY